MQKSDSVPAASALRDAEAVRAKAARQVLAAQKQLRQAQQTSASIADAVQELERSGERSTFVKGGEIYFRLDAETVKRDLREYEGSMPGLIQQHLDLEKEFCAEYAKAETSIQALSSSLRNRA